MKAHRLAAWSYACGLFVAVLGGSSCKTNNASATNNKYVSQQIGPAGGTINGPNGVVVVFPASAVMTTTTFTVGALDTSAEPTPPSGRTYSGDVYLFEPHGFVFATPVTITIPGATLGNVFHAA